MKSTLTNLEVLVSTKRIGSDPTVQQKFNLANFNDKDRFIHVATETMTEITGEPNPELVFELVEGALSDTDLEEAAVLITETNIDENLWFLFKKPYSDVSVYSAYTECFEIADYSITCILADISTILADISTSYIGHYDDNEALVEAWLQYHQLEYLVIATIMKNLNIDAMANDIRNDVACHDNHFFM